MVDSLIFRWPKPLCLSRQLQKFIHSQRPESRVDKESSHGSLELARRTRKNLKLTAPPASNCKTRVSLQQQQQQQQQRQQQPPPNLVQLETPNPWSLTKHALLWRFRPRFPVEFGVQNPFCVPTKFKHPGYSK